MLAAFAAAVNHFNLVVQRNHRAPLLDELRCLMACLLLLIKTCRPARYDNIVLIAINASQAEFDILQPGVRAKFLL